MTDTPEAKSLRQADLRHLLNEWDPIGVADLVDDEYDCLLAPLWDKLTHGATRASLSEYLWAEIQDHFGLDPERCGTDAFAEQLLALAATWTTSDLPGSAGAHAFPLSPGEPGAPRSRRRRGV